MSKIYFSRSISRTMSADHPVGDPTGGAAYGEKNDPITIAISVASMSSSYGAMMAGSIMAGITFTGAALSLVGSVTGNKTLTKIGMVAGIAGGLGQMGAFGETAKNATWGSTFGGSTTPPVNPTTAPLKGTPTADGSAAKAMSSSSATTSANAPVQVNATNTGPITGGNPSGVAFQNTGGSAYTGNYTPPNAAVATSDAVASAAKPSLMETAWQGTKDIGAGIMDFTKTNPYGAMAIGQTAQPIADYLSGKTDAEIDALEAQTGYADAKALEMQEAIAREKRRRENLNAGYRQVDAGINVNAGALNQAQAGGLISGAMQPA